MRDDRIPEGNRTMKVFGVDVGERSQIEVPRIRIVCLELKIRIRVFLRLLQHGVKA